MKVCLIHNLYHPYSRGGAEQVVVKTIEGFQKAGHSVVLITTHPEKSFEKEELPGLTIYRINPKNLSSYFYLGELPIWKRYLWHIIDVFHVGAAMKIRDILQEERPEIVFTHNLKGLSYMTPRAVQKAKIKQVHVLHDVQLVFPSGLMFYKKEEPSVLEKIYSTINKSLFFDVPYIISPSKFLLDFHDHFDFFENAKKRILKNPVFFENTKKGEAHTKDFTCLFVGQMVHHKGVADILEAIDQLQREGSQITLQLIGDGPLFADLKQRYESEGIEFLGRKTQEEVKQFYANAHLSIVASNCYENDPMVVSESIYSELPVLVSNIGGGIERLQDENGEILASLLFEAGNVDELKEKIHQIQNNYEEVKKYILKRKEKMNQQTMDTYIQDLLSL